MLFIPLKLKHQLMAEHESFPDKDCSLWMITMMKQNASRECLQIS